MVIWWLIVGWVRFRVCVVLESEFLCSMLRKVCSRFYGSVEVIYKCIVIKLFIVIFK